MLSFRSNKILYIGVGTLVCLMPALFASDLRADTGAIANTLREYKAMNADEQAQFLRELGLGPQAKPAPSIKPGPRNTAAVRAPAVAAVPPVAPVPAVPERPLVADPFLSKRNETADNVYKGCRGFVPLLRKDWKDIDFATCPQAIDKATGAEISYSNDRVKNNAIWAVDGTAALLYNFAGGGYAMSAGTYATVNRTSNSAASASDANVDKLAYGGVFEFGTSTSNDPYAANYFRIRGGGVEDHLKQTASSNATFEWMPVYEDHSFLHIHSPFVPIPGVPLIARFDPEILVQYASINAGSKPLSFNNLDRALRVGPQFTLTVYPGTDDFWSHFTGHVTYHWAYETYSGRELSWFQTSLTYNIDKAGYIGLTGSYQRGHDEDTGVFNNVYKIGLTGKI